MKNKRLYEKLSYNDLMLMNFSFGVLWLATEKNWIAIVSISIMVKKYFHNFKQNFSKFKNKEQKINKISKYVSIIRTNKSRKCY